MGYFFFYGRKIRMTYDEFKNSLFQMMAAVTMVWSYVGEMIFNMLILVGMVKMADRVVREMIVTQNCSVHIDLIV